jgi:hypothetical protein
LDGLEITGIIGDKDGSISHCGVRGYGVQNVGLMEKLIMEEACSFFIMTEKKREGVCKNFSKWSNFSYNRSQWVRYGYLKLSTPLG